MFLKERKLLNGIDFFDFVWKYDLIMFFVRYTLYNYCR